MPLLRWLLIASVLPLLMACQEPPAPPVNIEGLPDFSPLVERHGPAVVNISTVSSRSSPDSSDMDDMPDMLRRFFERFGQPDSPRRQPREGRSLGSGFVLDKAGHILTNHHVVADADTIIVRLGNREEYQAELLGADEQSDIALLRIDAKSLTPVVVGSSDALKVGEWVLAIGAPFGFDNTVTAGIVSAKGRSLPGDNYVPFIQTDVAINPGNSGGPLFNLRGEVVGINSQIFSRSGGFMGLSFAIPMDMAMDVVAQLKSEGRVTRGWLGVMIQDIDRDLASSFGLPQPMGALVAQVVPDSPAEDGNVQAGDVIIAVDGEPIFRSGELPRRIGMMAPGTEVSLTVMRDGEEVPLSIVVAPLPDDPMAALRGMPFTDEPQQPLGLTVDASTAEQRRPSRAPHGVIVSEVNDGPARRAGVRQGDLLVSLDNKPLTDPEIFADVVANLPEGKTVSLLLHRQGQPQFVAIRVEP